MPLHLNQTESVPKLLPSVWPKDVFLKNDFLLCVIVIITIISLFIIFFSPYQSVAVACGNAKFKIVFLFL